MMFQRKIYPLKLANFRFYIEGFFVSFIVSYT